MAVSNVEIRVNANNAVAQLSRLNSAAGTTASTFSRLQSAVAGIGIGLFVKSAIQAGAASNALATRLKLVTSEYGEYAQAQELVAKAQKTFGLSSTEAAEGVVDIFTRLRPLGISLRDIESTFVGFNTVAKLSGISAAGASAAFTQLAQALGSGRLQGDEFRSISEQIPGLLQAISSASGIASKDLKEYASQGKLTSDIVIRALKKLETEGADKIAKIVQDSDIQRFKDFENAAGDLTSAIGGKLLPAVLPLVKGATELVKAFGQLPDPIQTGTIAVLGTAAAAAILAPAIGTLNGLIATLAGGTVLKAAITGLSVVGEKALAAAAGKYALAGAITAANTKITLMTVGLGALKLALVALPFVAAAAGIAAVVVGAVKATKSINELNDAVKGNFDRFTEIDPVIQKFRTQLVKAEKNMKKGGRQAIIAKKKVDKLKEAIDNLEGEKVIRIRIQTIRDKFGIDPNESGVQNGRTRGRQGSIDARNAALAASTNLDLDKKRKDMSLRLLDLNDRLRAAQENEQQRLTATLALMVRKQEIAESDLLPLEKQNQLNQAHSDFRREVFAIDRRIAEQRAGEIADAAEGFEAQMAHQDQLREAIAEQKSAYDELNTAFRNGIVDSILDAVDGTRSLKDSLLGVIKSMARLILQQQLLNALKGFNLFGPSPSATEGFGVTPMTSTLDFSGAFANGGRPPVGKAALIGERGPELFVPSRAGTIIPNNALGGSSNITVNVDASGSSVEGNADQATQLGRVIGVAVQQELIKQKRPGGLLAS